MLGYISDDARGASDKLLFQMADRFRKDGLNVAGAVQENIGGDEVTACDMVLRIFGHSDPITISQNLGPGATGCRLDPDALERAVGFASAQLSDDTDLLIVNKFGKQEMEGGGFRQLIGEAMTLGVPVLTAIRPSYLEVFTSFTGDLAEEIKAEPSAINAWFDAQRMETF
ncbi:DUF2478 domain-containing protein [Actibacterium pelagium]|uniref:Nucleoside-triphosphatase THEP1 n=1 Tax=Actibacterium pelagium TaxID=2029103 RepID=A0A917EIX8_9RHOB|nr:DUF2478 domain-containing protein [Actibacterium pelagium]GGE48530.1 hypothetical protein GCM10011517_15470 [Actibacterium pelagium]